MVIGLSGQALRKFQHRRPRLSCEEKADLAGLHLKRQIEAGNSLVSENLYVGKAKLEGLVTDLGLSA